MQRGHDETTQRRLDKKQRKELDEGGRGHKGHKGCRVTTVLGFQISADDLRCAGRIGECSHARSIGPGGKSKASEGMPLKRGIIGWRVSTKQDKKQRCRTVGTKEQRLQNETIERMQTVVVKIRSWLQRRSLWPARRV